MLSFQSVFAIACISVLAVPGHAQGMCSWDVTQFPSKKVVAIKCGVSDDCCTDVQWGSDLIKKAMAVDPNGPEMDSFREKIKIVQYQVEQDCEADKTAIMTCMKDQLPPAGMVAETTLQMISIGDDTVCDDTAVGNIYKFECSKDGIEFMFDCSKGKDGTTTTNMFGSTSTKKDCDCGIMDEATYRAAFCDDSRASMTGKNTHEWITTLLFAAAFGAIGGLGVIAAVSWLLPRQSVQQQSELLG